MTRAPYFEGEQSGRLTLLHEVGVERGKLRWMAECVCGNEIKIIASLFRKGRVKSCGCLRNDLTSKRFRKHGKTDSLEHQSWRGMHQRCRSPNASNYKHYGGRGITICERWFDLQNFCDDMGPRLSKEYTLERIDTNGNYEPDNCVWLPQKLQAKNTRQNVWIDFNGERLTLTDALSELGVGHISIYHRVQRYNETHQQAFDYHAKRLHGLSNELSPPVLMRDD